MARVRSYPVVEKDEIVWVWLLDPAKADTAVIADDPYHNDLGQWPNKHELAVAWRPPGPPRSQLKFFQG
jgi:vanillate O-demethylase monooxygenase subunit